MDENKLKPCPFCGGTVELERARDTTIEKYGTRKWWGVVCRNTTNLGGTCAIEQRPSASPEAAIERWNRRAPASEGEQK
ncbi:Lar family restriction alleviation protein [Burkholderia multivorans]|nr:Lar family restriction alleviation protein [Burkholderia multivorans]MCA8502212.1 Lar family restriction alleviation protein [Burkholderia multivorans]